MANKRSHTDLDQYPRHEIFKSANNLHEYPPTSPYRASSTTTHPFNAARDSSFTHGVIGIEQVVASSQRESTPSPPNPAVIAQLRYRILCTESELDSSTVTLQHAIAELEFLVSELNVIVTGLRERANDRARVLAGGEGLIPAWDVTMRMMERRDVVLGKIKEYERVQKHAREDVEELEKRVGELKREWNAAGGK